MALSLYGIYGFNTQPPEGGWFLTTAPAFPFWTCFNTQPPEGGWVKRDRQEVNRKGFNTQPPEGGWGLLRINSLDSG